MTPPPRAGTLADGTPVLRYGPDDGPQVIVLQPLFEEMNRCRALVAALCRGLAAAGIGCWLPDLPGTGEDTRALDTIGWADWRRAADAAMAAVHGETGAPPPTIAIRGGALLDRGGARRWRLAPVDGRSLLRDLERAGLTGEPMAGYTLSGALRDGLAVAAPTRDARVIRLEGDAREADAHVAGSALWRRSEPASDDALAERLVADILRFLGHSSDSWKPDPHPFATLDRDCRQDDSRWVDVVAVEDDWITVTVDGPRAATRGWVFVTGGTQTRAGPHRLYERLASRLAATGDAVIRYDRRGVGDSPGTDPGYAGQRADMAAAVAALRDARPSIRTVGGFGLCDGATALALHGRSVGVDRLVLANPWVVEPVGDEPPAAAVRAHYRDRLRDPAAWGRLLRGGVDLRRLVRSLARGATADDTSLAARVAAGVPPDATIVLADGDNTARAFADAWARVATAPLETIRVDTRSHSFAGARAFDALADAVTRRR